MQLEVISAGNHIVNRVSEAETTIKRVNEDKNGKQKVLSLDYLSCPQIWVIEKKEERRKRKWATGQRSSTRKRATESYSERSKTKETFFVGRTTWKFCSGGEKMKMLAATKVSGSKKSEQKAGA